MIKIIITVLISFISFSVYSQEQFLGDTKEDIRIMCKAIKIKKLKSGKTDDGLYTYDIFSMTASEIRFNYDSSDRCVLVARSAKHRYINEALRELNNESRYLNIGDNEWSTLDRKHRVKILLYYDDFVLLYTSF